MFTIAGNIKQFSF